MDFPCAPASRALRCTRTCKIKAAEFGAKQFSSKMHVMICIPEIMKTFNFVLYELFFSSFLAWVGPRHGVSGFSGGCPLPPSHWGRSVSRFEIQDVIESSFYDDSWKSGITMIQRHHSQPFRVFPTTIHGNLGLLSFHSRNK